MEWLRVVPILNAKREDDRNRMYVLISNTRMPDPLVTWSSAEVWEALLQPSPLPYTVFSFPRGQTFGLIVFGVVDSAFLLSMSSFGLDMISSDSCIRCGHMGMWQHDDARTTRLLPVPLTPGAAKACLAF